MTVNSRSFKVRFLTKHNWVNSGMKNLCIRHQLRMSKYLSHLTNIFWDDAHIFICLFLHWIALRRFVALVSKWLFKNGSKAYPHEDSCLRVSDAIWSGASWVLVRFKQSFIFYLEKLSALVPLCISESSHILIHLALDFISCLNFQTGVKTYTY